MISRMRICKTRMGSRPKFFKMFSRNSIPVHAEIELKISRPLLSAKNSGTFLLMRSFPDLESRQPNHHWVGLSSCWLQPLSVQCYRSGMADERARKNSVKA